MPKSDVTKPKQRAVKPLDLLFPEPGPRLTRFLADFQDALKVVLPLSAKHRRALPTGIQELSRLLTTERSELTGDYLRSAPAVAAYCHYFLPWNIYRLGRLLLGLGPDRLPVPTNGLVLDLGSGPLTMILALWAARPDLRDKKLRCICVDRANKIMDLGLKLFQEIAGDGWDVETLHAPLDIGLSRIRERADLVLAANVLNEFRGPVKGRDNTAERLERTVLRMADKAGENGRMLLVEPGTRFGGRLVASARETALEHGLTAPAPCPHNLDCPMPGAVGKPWCHFTFDLPGAPTWLTRLSTQASLGKKSASLSFTLLSAQPPKQSQKGPKALPVRVVSDAFPLSAPLQGHGRYGCSPLGMVLLATGKRDARDLTSGELLLCDEPEQPTRDAKSGALVVGL